MKKLTTILEQLSGKKPEVSTSENEQTKTSKSYGEHIHDLMLGLDVDNLALTNEELKKQRVHGLIEAVQLYEHNPKRIVVKHDGEVGRHQTAGLLAPSHATDRIMFAHEHRNEVYGKHEGGSRSSSI